MYKDEGCNTLTANTYTYKLYPQSRFSTDNISTFLIIINYALVMPNEMILAFLNGKIIN